MQERLQYGLYGLYPKYRIYNEPLSIFLGMVGHALVALTLQSDRGSLGDQCKYFNHTLYIILIIDIIILYYLKCVRKYGLF